MKGKWKNEIGNGSREISAQDVILDGLIPSEYLVLVLLLKLKFSMIKNSQSQKRLKITRILWYIWIKNTHKWATAKGGQIYILEEPRFRWH